MPAAAARTTCRQTKVFRAAALECLDLLAPRRVPENHYGLSARRARRDALDALSDMELLENYRAAARREDGAAYVQELFRRHYAKVVGWCLRLTGDRDDASDLAQAIFAKAYRGLDSFRGHAKVSTWLYAITRSECMNYRKSRGREIPGSRALGGPQGAELDEVPDFDRVSPDEALEHQGAVRVAQTLLDQALDETERQVFTLHYGEDMPLDSITRLLRLPNRSGAKAYIVSARRKLSRAVRLWKARAEGFDGEGRLP
jgi:RNA polymerase sigma-70 factor, ECF subfamily